MAASRIGSVVGARRAELDVRLGDIDVRLEARAVDCFTGGVQVARVREPQTAILWQLDQLLQAGATDRVFADQLRAIVTVERGREHFGGTRRSGGDEQSVPAARSNRRRDSR